MTNISATKVYIPPPRHSYWEVRKVIHLDNSGCIWPSVHFLSDASANGEISLDARWFAKLTYSNTVGYLQFGNRTDVFTPIKFDT